MDQKEERRKVIIGHSPDPDDAFMFHALTNEKFPTGNIEYQHQLMDIESLNALAKEESLEVSAVSIHAYPEIAHNYALMNCGASMGEGYGPMIVSKKNISLEEVKSNAIAIPGIKTSAFLALRLCWGDFQYQVVPFDEIIPRIVSGEFTSGLIIHEGQLTYKDSDLDVHLNLGKWWNEITGGLPLPLGGNVVKKSLGTEMVKQITNDTKKSIQYALEHPDEALEFAKKWGRGIDDATNEEFVSMYVNQRTISYGEDGRESIRLFISMGQEIGLISNDFDVSSIEFVGAEV